MRSGESRPPINDLMVLFVFLAIVFTPCALAYRQLGREKTLAVSAAASPVNFAAINEPLSVTPPSTSDRQSLAASGRPYAQRSTWQ